VTVAILEATRGRTWKQAQQDARRVRAVRARARIRVPVPSIAPAAEPRERGPLVGAAVSVGLHAAVVALAFVRAADRPAEHERVAIEIREVTPPVESVVAEPAVPEVEAPRRTPKPVVADPIETAASEPPAEAPPAEPVVGLSADSTAGVSDGPGFAVGNTRMGTTETVARDPSSVGKLSRTPPGMRGTGAKLVRPKRQGRSEPAYPADLKTQGLEGDVEVSVDLTPEGRVTAARVTHGSRYPAFDEAALAAARIERFSPATSDGEPVAFTLTYTIRFRITE
jgi:periplasmic protein TonB